MPSLLIPSLPTTSLWTCASERARLQQGQEVGVTSSLSSSVHMSALEVGPQLRAVGRENSGRYTSDLWPNNHVWLPSWPEFSLVGRVLITLGPEARRTSCPGLGTGIPVCTVEMFVTSVGRQGGGTTFMLIWMGQDMGMEEGNKFNDWDGVIGVYFTTL